MAVQKKKKGLTERQARIIDVRRDKTDGAGLYRVEKGVQTGPDKSVRKMPDANVVPKKKTNKDKKEDRIKRKKGEGKYKGVPKYYERRNDRNTRPRRRVKNLQKTVIQRIRRNIRKATI